MILRPSPAVERGEDFAERRLDEVHERIGVGERRNHGLGPQQRLPTVTNGAALLEKFAQE